MMIKARGRTSPDNMFWGGGKKKMLKVIGMHKQKVKTKQPESSSLARKKQEQTLQKVVIKGELSPAGCQKAYLQMQFLLRSLEQSHISKVQHQP